MVKLEYSRCNANMKLDEFTTVPKGSGLLYYTNGSHDGFVKFCVDEVFEDRGFIDIRRRKRGKS